MYQLKQKQSIAETLQQMRRNTEKNQHPHFQVQTFKPAANQFPRQNNCSCTGLIASEGYLQIARG